MMATLPEYRRQGAANLMLKWMTEFADQHGLLFYVEAEPTGVEMCQKAGFEIHDRFEVKVEDGSPYVLTCMSREPKQV